MACNGPLSFCSCCPAIQHAWLSLRMQQCSEHCAAPTSLPMCRCCQEPGSCAPWPLLADGSPFTNLCELPGSFCNDQGNLVQLNMTGEWCAWRATLQPADQACKASARPGGGWAGLKGPTLWETLGAAWRWGRIDLRSLVT